ncbi:hypothetical protein [Pseudomonas sp. GD03944]|uniref:hypothetical protein n=1 Tax=Pseudomonas sp. GD03944 TaxID=2975409 RepID=UPI00244A6107|nr:hypothetical protein [Pseudomonas sp. GD03944]MDH1265411.1 hypothetical protein [Pseudomonas sp. GD03944]
MKSTIPMFCLAAALVALAGCDAAEQSAQKLVEKAEEAVQEVAREAISETVNELNKQVDDIQQSANEVLGKPEASQEQQDGEDEQKPSDQVMPPAGGVET